MTRNPDTPAPRRFENPSPRLTQRTRALLDNESVEIGMAVVLSTAHISEAMMNAIEKGLPDEPEAPETAATTYGAIVIVPRSEENLPERLECDPNGALVALMRWAQKRAYRYLHFDADAETIEGFVTYDW